MSRAIWKYEFEVTEIVQVYDVPAGAKPVHVAAQGRHVCLWMDVDNEATMGERSFMVAGTGHDGLPADAAYLGAAHIHPFVWHLFEVIE